MCQPASQDQGCLQGCPARLASALVREEVEGVPGCRHVWEMPLNHQGSFCLGVVFFFNFSIYMTCCCSVPQSCPTLCDPVDCSTPGFPILHHLLSLLKLMSIESVMPSNYLVLCCPLLPCLQSFLALGSFQMSQLFASGSQSISFSFNISPSSEYSGLISIRLDLFAVQGTLLQHHSSKASILQRSAFFMVQFSHPYMATGKTIALTRWTFVVKVMFLLFNMLCCS